MEQLKINREKSVQENFLGCNAVYHGYAGMPDDSGRVYTEEQCELEADRIKALGVKIVRTYHKWWAWSRDTGWDWENDTMKAFYRWCERMQKRGIEIALHGGWSSYDDIMGSSFAGASPFADGGLSFEEALPNFTAWVSECLHQLIEVRGFTNIKYLMLFTESEGIRNRGLDDCYYWETASRAIHNRLLKDGRRHYVKLVGPNENIRRWDDFKLLKYTVDNASDFLDIHSAHVYVNTEIASKDCVYSGNCAACLQKPGFRVGQHVDLKPNTEYEMCGYVKVVSEDYLHMSGTVGMGILTLPEKHSPVQGAAGYAMGKNGTTRLTVNSVKMVDPAPYEENWFLLKHTFKTDDNVNGVFGFFSDIQTGAVVYGDDFCLKEVGSTENLLKNPSFEEGDLHWNNVMARVGFYDSYVAWYEWEKKMLSVVTDGKPFWHDEYNNTFRFMERFNDPLHGTRVVMGNLGMLNAGAQSTLIWTAFDQQWPNNHTNNNDSFQDGNHRCGLMPVLTQSLVPYPDYYAFGLLAKYIGGEGTKIFAEEKASERLHLTLSEQPDDNITVVVASMRPESAEFNVDLGAPCDKPFYRHLFSPETVKPDEKAELVKADKTVSATGGSFSDTIPAYGVVVYTTKE
ncbi:MAG: hypothetical protein IJE01_04935 [Clostridia bacterium]|nr:hypothetical protein [Clostridia bacterium]